MNSLAIGQYFPADTFIHRLDPRTKLLCVILYIIALFCAKSAVSYGIVFLLLLLAVVLSCVRIDVLLRSVRPILIVIIFTAVLNLFYTSGDVVAKFWIFTVTRQGIEHAAAMVLRITMLVLGTFLLTYTTSPMDITDALEMLLRPLRKIGVPVHELSMMMCIALRFIPTLMNETTKLISAQKARGADFESGNLFRRAKAMVPILVPLFISAFRRADDLATAMESRCYNGGEGRTKMKQFSFSAADYVAFAVCIAATVLTIVFA